MSEASPPEAGGRVDGFHHVSAIAGDPVRNRKFLTETLGLRLVKRTVNFDEPYVYHLYYGDTVATPGTVLTSFAYPRDDPGRVGTGQPGEVAFAVPAGEETVDYWLDRFEAHDVDHDEPEDRFGDEARSTPEPASDRTPRAETTIPFRDPDGTPLALVATDDLPDGEPWTEAVPGEHAIRGVHGVTLHSANVFVTARVLEVFGFDLVAQSGDRVRYVGPGGDPDGVPGDDPDADETGGTGTAHRPVVDLVDRDVPWGKEGPGTIHHVAFEVADRDALFAWTETLRAAGLEPSRVKDRHYFEAVYVRDPGGILFELSTTGPGVTVDEAVDELGSDLRLPPWLAADREMIEPQLPPLSATEVEP